MLSNLDIQSEIKVFYNNEKGKIDLVTKKIVKDFISLSSVTDQDIVDLKQTLNNNLPNIPKKQTLQIELAKEVLDMLYSYTDEKIDDFVDTQISVGLKSLADSLSNYASNSVMELILTNYATIEALDASMAQASSTYQVQGDYAVNSALEALSAKEQVDVDNLQSSLSSLQNLVNSMTGLDGSFTSQISSLQATLEVLGLEVGDVSNQSSIAQVLVNVQNQITSLANDLENNYALNSALLALESKESADVSTLTSSLEAAKQSATDALNAAMTQASSTYQVQGDYVVNSDLDAAKQSATDALNAYAAQAASTYQVQGDYAVNSDLEAAKQSATDALNAYAAQAASTYQVQGDYAVNSDVTNLQTQALTFAAQSYVDATFQEKDDYVVNSALEAAANAATDALNAYAAQASSTYQVQGDYAVNSALVALSVKEQGDVDNLQSSLSSLQNLVNSMSGLDGNFTSQISSLQATLAALGLEVGDVENQSSIAQVLINVQDQITSLVSDLLDLESKESEDFSTLASSLVTATNSATDALNAAMTQVASTYQVQGDYAVNSDVTNLQTQALTFAAQSYVDATFQEKGDYAVNSDVVNLQTQAQPVNILNTIVANLKTRLDGDIDNYFQVHIAVTKGLFFDGPEYPSVNNLLQIIEDQSSLTGNSPSQVCQALVSSLSNLNGNVQVSDIAEVFSGALNFAASTDITYNNYFPGFLDDISKSVNAVSYGVVASEIRDLYSRLQLDNFRITTINNNLSAYVTSDSADNTYATLAQIGNKDLSSVNPENADHSVAAVIFDVNSSLSSTISSLSNYAELTNNYISASNIPDLSATYIPISSAVSFQAAGNYAQNSALTALTTNVNTINNSLSNYASTSSVAVLASAINNVVGGSVAKYCRSSNNGDTFQSVSDITTIFNDVPGALSAWRACAKYVTSIGTESNIYITPTGLVGDCTTMDVPNAFVYCLAAL